MINNFILLLLSLSIICRISSCDDKYSQAKRIPIEENIKGFCGTEHQAYTITYIDPSKEEIDSYMGVTRIQSRVNNELADVIVAGKSNIDNFLYAQNSWTIPRGHPRFNKSLCFDLSKKAVYDYKYDTKLFYDKYKYFHERFYYFYIKVPSIIHPTGIVMMNCGYIQLLDGCETRFKFIGRKWFKGCLKTFDKLKLFDGDSLNTTVRHCYDSLTVKGLHKSMIPIVKNHIINDNLLRYDRVVVMSASWDHNYHHLMADSLTKIIRLLPFLKANPDVKIHYRRFEIITDPDKALLGSKMRDRVLSLLGISPSRLLWGPILANEVILPAAMPCNWVMARPLELRNLSQVLIHNAKLEMNKLQKPTNLPNKKPSKLVILQRWIPKNPIIQELDYREWTDETYKQVVDAFIIQYPQLELVEMSSNSTGLMSHLSLAEQLLIFQDTAVLVGAHGAGLHNTIFMQEGSLLVEIAAKFDARIQPVCGYHGPLAAIFGVHHYIHYYDTKISKPAPPMNYHRIARESRDFYDELNNK